MGEPAVISVRDIGKRYVLERQGLGRLRAWMSGKPSDPSREFWAVRGVNFDVLRGESVGIVGRNGSGKSTLLQIIAGTLTPSEGTVEIRGRIAALLELGSGFNPHFTGRENVYMAGAIMGMNARQMEQKFDAIASFADVGRFLDQPLAVYSSGMHARLAFAVAISVEPDILIIDETLSVGDAGFQQRCIGRLRALMDSGVSLLIVSHAGEMIKGLCGKGLVLNAGRQVMFGSASDAVDRYAAVLRDLGTQRAMERLAATRPELAAAISGGGTPQRDLPATAASRSDAEHGGAAPESVTSSDEAVDVPATPGTVRIEQASLLDEQGQRLDEGAYVRFGERLTLEVVIRGGATEVDRLDLVMTVRDGVGVTIFGASYWEEVGTLIRLARDEQATVRFSFENRLSPGGGASGGKRGRHGVTLALCRRPNERGAGVVTLEYRDVAAAFAVLGPVGSKTVRGKILVPMRVESKIASPR